jgi:hypothetical protein
MKEGTAITGVFASVKKPDLKDMALVDFDIIKEAWSTYKLADGNFLRMKTNVVKVRKHPTMKAPDGTPVYNIQSNVTLGVFSPDEMLKLKEFENKR